MSDGRLSFLTGLPRAGNTLLASVLNQNPGMRVTGASPLVEIVHRLSSVRDTETFRSFPDSDAVDRAIAAAAGAYHGSFNGRVLDRGAWGTETNFELLRRHIDPDPRLVVLLRPVEQVVASFLRWAEANPDSYLGRIPTAAARIEKVMEEGGHTMQGLKSVWNMRKLEHLRYALFLDYDELVSDPRSAVGRIYDFLGLERFDHDYEGFGQLAVRGRSYDDDGTNQPGLHTLRTGAVERAAYNVGDYLTAEQISEVSRHNFWLPCRK